MCLASRIHNIFSYDQTTPRHHELAVTVFDHSDFPEYYCSTTTGINFPSPFSGFAGVFAIIQSSIMRLGPSKWPHLALVPVVNTLQDFANNLQVNDEAYMAFSIAEGALVVHGNSVEELLTLCDHACLEIASAKLNSNSVGPDTQDSIRHNKARHNHLSEPELDGSWAFAESLGPLNMGGVGEPFLGGFRDPWEQQLDLDDEHFSDPFGSISPSSYVSSISPTHSNMSPLSQLSSISPFFPVLPLDRDEHGAPVMTVSLRDINSEGTVDARSVMLNASETVHLEGPSHSESLSSHQMNTAITDNLGTSPAKLKEPSSSLQVPTWYSEASVIRRSKRPARRSAPYQPPKLIRPSSSPSCSTLSDLSSLPPSRQTSPLLSDVDGEFDIESESGGDEPIKTRPQHKRVRKSKKRFHCTFCPESFTREADVERHHKSCLLNPDREPRRNCDYCDRKLPVRDDAKERHWRSTSCQSLAIRRGIVPGSLPLDYA